MRARLRKLTRQIGRRGACLLFLAILDLLYAYSLYETPLKQRTFDLLLPYQVWAMIWLAVGITCLNQAFMRVDRVAFSLAVGLKLAWGGALGAVWLTHPSADPRGWVVVPIYWGFAAFVAIVASWPELPEGGPWARP